MHEKKNLDVEEISFYYMREKERRICEETSKTRYS